MVECKQNKSPSYGKLILEKERMAWGSLKLALGVQILRKVKSSFNVLVGQPLPWVQNNHGLTR
jgi:hypothetical protein